MSQVFDKAARMELHKLLREELHHKAAMDYIKALEEIAKLAVLATKPHSSDVVIKLDAALERVDWMRE